MINQRNYRDVGNLHLWHLWKLSNFCKHSPLFLPVRMGPNWARLPPLPRLWTLNLRLPPTPTPPHPHLLWYSCSISIIFSRRFHHIPCPYNSKLFSTKNQFNIKLIIWCSMFPQEVSISVKQLSDLKNFIMKNLFVKPLNYYSKFLK